MKKILITIIVLLPQLAFAVGPYFVSAGDLVASYHGSEQAIPLPPAYQPGDLLLFMGFTPEGMPTPPSGWIHACTYNYYKFATANETAPLFAVNQGAIAGIIAAYRGVNKNVTLPCIPEYGGQAGGIYGTPGTYYPPDSSQTPKFASGSAPAFTVNYSNSLRVVTYQSESSDSEPIDVHDASGTLMQDAFHKATYASNCTDYFNLGFFSSPFMSVGSTGALYWGTTGNGGGHRADRTCSYTSPVAWFSQILLLPATVTHASPPGGAYITQQQVTLSIDGAGIIYFTTDGTTPSTASETYSTPITVSTATTINFFGVSSEGLMEDTVNSETYTFPSGIFAFLTIVKDGTENGTVRSNPAGINCDDSVSSCEPVLFPLNSHISLSAIPSVGGSCFLGWSGDNDCADGAVTMTGDINCNATFDTCFGQSVRMASIGYNSILDAYDVAKMSDSIIEVTATNQSVTLDFDQGKAFTLKGGHDCAFAPLPYSYTTITGSLTITNGSITLDKIVIM